MCYGGYITLARKFQNNWLWEESRTFSSAEAWLDLIFLAQYDKGVNHVKGKMIKLERGQLMGSYRFLGKRWKWSKNKVVYFIKKLEKESMCETVTKGGVTVLTLCNYDAYNAPKNYSTPQKGQTKDTERTQKGQKKDTERTEKGQIKEVKKERNKELNKMPKKENTKEKKFNFENELQKIVNDKQLVSDFVNYRKERKYSLSKSVFNSLAKQIEIVTTDLGGVADDCLLMILERNWRGFKAEWYKNTTQPKISQKNTVKTLSHPSVNYHNHKIEDYDDF